jgi:hypothetical protein
VDVSGTDTRSSNGRHARTPEQVRAEIAREREALVGTTQELEAKLRTATDVTSKLSKNLQVVAAGVLVGGFVLAGGIGATARYFFRRGRERDEVFEAGRWRVHKRR